jgi:hypothetical protein
MDKKENFGLSWFIVIALMAGFVFLIYSQNLKFTGEATGTATVTVNSTTSISMIDSTIAFGSQNAGTETNSESVGDVHTVQNDGTTDINITAQVTSENFVNDTTSTFRCRCGRAPPGSSCDTNTYASGACVSSAKNLITCLDPTDSQDDADLNFSIVIPPDEPAGAKSVTITYTAVANSSAC